MYYPRGPLAAIKVNLELWGKTAERQLMFNGTVNCSLSSPSRPSCAHHHHQRKRSPLGARLIFNTGLLLPRKFDDKQRQALRSVVLESADVDYTRTQAPVNRNLSPPQPAFRWHLIPLTRVRKVQNVGAVSSLLSDELRESGDSDKYGRLICHRNSMRVLSSRMCRHGRGRKMLKFPKKRCARTHSRLPENVSVFDIYARARACESA